jgi:hypothetical protein
MPRYIGPYPVLKRIGVLAYKLKLLEWLLDVHDVFHVSQLRKCLQVVSDTIDLQDDMWYQEVPIKILDTMTKRTWTKAINLYKVQCSRHSEAESMWEKEDALREEYT